MKFAENDYEHIHSNMLKILKYIHKILTQNNIFYSLACGSVLGAVREKGFISWDLDADIFILIEDREKIRYLLKEALPSEFYYEDSSINNISSHDDISFVYKKTVFSVDIYPLFGFPEAISDQQKFIRKCKIVNKLFSCKYSDVRRVRNKLKWPIFMCLKIIEKLIPNSFFRKKIIKLENQNKNSNLISYMALDGRIEEIFEKEVLKDTILVMFEDTFLSIPKQYDFYLSKVYGEDYMTPRRY